MKMFTVHDASLSPLGSDRVAVLVEGDRHLAGPARPELVGVARRQVGRELDAGELEGSDVVRYLNRLADYLYMLARAAEGDWIPSRRKEDR